MQIKMKENIDFTSDDTDQEMTHFDEGQVGNGGGRTGNGNRNRNSVKKEKNSSNGGQKRKHDNNE